MQITVYETQTVFDELKSQWNELLSRSQANRIFSTWEWQSTWWSAYHPGDLWVLTITNENGNLVGIAPWFIEHHPQRGRIVRTIGCVEVTDYLDIIIDLEHFDAALAAIASFVSSHHDHFDMIDLCNIPETSLTYKVLPEKLIEQGFNVKLVQQEVCPIIKLPSSWEQYFEILDKKQRHELRRKLRRAEGATESVSWYIVDKKHVLVDEIEQFIHLMASSHTDKANFLKDEQNQTFFRAIVPIIFEKDWLQMSFLMIDGEPAAAYLNFIYGDSVQVYNSGLLPEKYGHLSPGIVLLAHNIQYAIEHGYRIFDFLRGNETYKYRMGAEETKVHMLIAES